MINGILDAVRSTVREEFEACIAIHKIGVLPKQAEDGGMLSTERAAQKAGVVARTIREWIKKGNLPVSRPPGSNRFWVKTADLDAYLSKLGDGSRVVDIEKEADEIMRQVMKRE